MQLLCNRFSARKLEKEGRHYTNSIVTLFCYCSKAENYKNVTVPQVHIFAVVVVQLVLLGSDDALDIAKKRLKTQLQNHPQMEIDSFLTTW